MKSDFKIGDKILCISIDSQDAFGLHVIQEDRGDCWAVEALDFSTGIDIVPGYNHYLIPKNKSTSYDGSIIMRAFDEQAEKNAGRHKCHCPKEVWLHLGCKCGGC